jgi:L-fuconolactonase
LRFEIVDGYCHCGLSKYLPIDAVRRVMSSHRVARAVLVQHLGEYDNGYIEGIVREDPALFAGVFLIDLQNEAVAEHLNYWTNRGVFRGIRLIARTLATHPTVWQRAAALGLNIIVYDEPTIAPYANLLASFAAENPETRLVLSHFGMPDLREAPYYRSYRPILSLGEWKNVFVQISGMHMFANPPYREFVPLGEQLVETFGVRRLVYGSNYPVMREEALYGDELNLVLMGRLGIPENATCDVLGKTAIELWFDRIPEKIPI